MKYSLYTMGKNISRISLILFLIAGMTLLVVSRVSATVTIISLNPMEIPSVEPGEWFTVDVNVTDVTNLKLWEFRLSYNTTLLNATFVSPSPDTIICTNWIPKDGSIWHPDGPPTIDETNGVVRTGAQFQSGQEFTGNGTFVTINFTATEIGDSFLNFSFTILLDSGYHSIDHDTLDGSVTVISEFPLAVAMPLLLIATLTVTLLGKMFWARKRKDAPTAD